MKILALLLIPALLGTLALSAIAWTTSDAGTCYTIDAADARNHCLAKARRDTGMCYSIQRQDLRAQCLAEVRGEAAH